MRYEARITAYDCLDKVQVVLNASDTTATATNDLTMHLNLAVTVDGKGTDDVRQWVREALVALLSSL